MNQIFFTLGIESWKPGLTALLLPPVPLLLLVLVGARLMFRRRLLAWLLVLLGVVGIWLACTPAVGVLLTRALLSPPPPLSLDAMRDLRRAPDTVIVVLGGGRQVLAPEYVLSNLSPRSMERLRYGLWLGRETGLPVGFSGGVGHGAPEGASEAEIAARIAEREFGRPLRWTEGESRDTRENAMRTVALLEREGVKRIVLVTHDFHMRRALRNFERAAAQHSGLPQVLPAPMGLPAPGSGLQLGDWLPSAAGLTDTNMALREWLGFVAGA
jgi:uncharacterized SAM-binding protein YcdF (DUF218 family)